MREQRFSRQRKRVLQAVQARRDHPTADEVYLDVRRADERISRGTVYRNLNQLAESGDVRHVRLPEADRYDWRVEPHYHLLCSGCGKVIDAPAPYQPELDRSSAEASGWEIALHRTIFEGLCPDCQAKRRAPEA